MKDGGWGRIVNFGSGSVFQGTAGPSHYAAAKAGVLGLTRSLAWTGWRSAPTASCWPAPAATGMCGCGIQRPVSRSASPYQPTSLTGRACTGWRSALTASCSASRGPRCPLLRCGPGNVTAGPAGCGSVRRDVGGRRCPERPHPVPGVTLSDAGGQGERTRTRRSVRQAQGPSARLRPCIKIVLSASDCWLRRPGGGRSAAAAGRDPGGARLPGPHEGSRD